MFPPKQTAFNFMTAALVFSAQAEGQSADLTNLSTSLQAISSTYYPGIRQLGQQIYAHPEIATQERFAHDLITGYFSDEKPGLFDVTRHAYGFPTAFKLEFANNSTIGNGQEEDVPTIAFLAEYDALPAVNHACGHNLIATVGLSAAAFTRQALIDYNIAGKVVVYGTFDEEDKAGKHKLLQAGAFGDSNAVFMEAHPTIASAVQPMQARVNALATIREANHSQAVESAYKELLVVADLVGQLPGHASTASSVEDVGMYTTNVVQTEIELGVNGTSEDVVDEIARSVKANGTSFASQNWTLKEDTDGVAINFTGPGGHASQGTKGPLLFSAEVFRALQANSSSLSYYLPSNTSHTELDITVSVRTRYTHELPSVRSFVDSAMRSTSIPDSISYDDPYPALEPHADLGAHFINLMNTDSTLVLANDTWNASAIAPAATDASFLQNATVDPTSFNVTKTDRVMFHPNYNICEPGTLAVCPFNHEAEFNELADLDFAYSQTERVARALAHTAVELINDPAFMKSVRAITQ